MIFPVASNECPDGWEFFEGSCYTLGATSKDFEYARRECIELDGYLAEVTTQEENDFVKDLVSRTAADDVSGAYMGLQMLSWKGVWELRSSGTPAPYYDFATPSKRQTSSEYSCAVFDRASDWSWVTQGCDIQQGMRFVCERCPMQRECFQGSCYDLRCLSEAHRYIEDTCGNAGGQVLEINSGEENDFIKGFLRKATLPLSTYLNPGNVWLGATDQDTEGDLRWMSDNSEVTFTDWADGEPNNFGVNRGRNSDCVVLDSKNDWKWNDEDCLHKSYVMCEMEDVSAITG
ncbi:mannose receptor, C type 1-like 1 [Elysia marginata]|uniref:Mannose receptor, C type 1-like 1 n=1 Tax=Elysia marginata TaxID=1093978 RepID=A0AAV4GL20_9GAST|nr:mannose receptor, C type 1-like 1 [Elysia marginata]